MSRLALHGLDEIATRCRIREAIGVCAPPLEPEQVADDVTRLVVSARERADLEPQERARLLLTANGSEHA